MPEISTAIGHDHDVQFIWNYWPFYYVLWPLAFLNILLLPFFILQLPLMIIWNTLTAILQFIILLPFMIGFSIFGFILLLPFGAIAGVTYLLYALIVGTGIP